MSFTNWFRSEEKGIIFWHEFAWEIVAHIIPCVRYVVAAVGIHCASPDVTRPWRRNISIPHNSFFISYTFDLSSNQLQVSKQKGIVKDCQAKPILILSNTNSILLSMNLPNLLCFPFPTIFVFSFLFFYTFCLTSTKTFITMIQSALNIYLQRKLCS